MLEGEPLDLRSLGSASNLQTPGGGSRPDARPTCARCGLPCETRRVACSATWAAGPAAPGVPAPARAAPLSASHERRPGCGGGGGGGGRREPGAGGEAAEAAGPAPGGAGEALRATSVREPAESGHPGRDNSGSSGRERRSHLPETRRTARRREARPAPAWTGGRPAARSSPQRRVGGEREGGAGPGTLTALHLSLPPPASLPPSFPPGGGAGARGRGGELRAGVRLCSGTRLPAPPLPARGRILRMVVTSPCGGPFAPGRMHARSFG